MAAAGAPSWAVAAPSWASAIGRAAAADASAVVGESAVLGESAGERIQLSERRPGLDRSEADRSERSVIDGPACFAGATRCAFERRSIWRPGTAAALEAAALEAAWAAAVWGVPSRPRRCCSAACSSAASDAAVTLPAGARLRLMSFSAMARKMDSSDGCEVEHQWQSMAINGNQWQSMAINGNQSDGCEVDQSEGQRKGIGGCGRSSRAREIAPARPSIRGWEIGAN